MESSMGTLCQYCKVLEIDDAAWGGFRDESVPGKNVAAFSGGVVDTLGDSHFLTERYREKYPGSYGPVKIRYFTCQYDREDTFPEMPGLKQSATGCGFCALLRNWIRWQSYEPTYRFNEPERPIVIQSFDYTIHEIIGKNGVPFRIFGGLKVNAFEADGGFKSRFNGAGITIYAPKGPCATWLSIPEEPPKNQDLWEKISMIKSSLWKCSEECGHSKFSDLVPSRLIYVGDNTEDPRLVVLSNPEHLPEDCTKDDVKYAVLSYCWGESTSSALMTTMGNLATHLKKIPLAKIPPTCRDAILVTRALGLKWLWIDAFCIIQGNNADWHNQAAEMAGVYGNAFVTIIPLRSLSSHDGFLDRLKTPAEVRVPFKSSIDPSVKGYYTIRASPDERDAHRALWRELRCSKWKSRGWTYQEDTMSGRKLYFGETDIYFRCGSQRTITCQSSTAEPSTLYGESWRFADRTKIGWYKSVEEFSTRNLTFKTDTFPAISAIAEMHCNGGQEDYQCGLWKSDLHYGVLWIAINGKSSPEEHMKKLTSQTDYVAPSWSWASAHAMGYSVEFSGADHFPLWKILEIEVLPVDASNPLGSILSGHILVRGRWCALSSLRLAYPQKLFSKGDKWCGNCCFDWDGLCPERDRPESLPESYTERMVILLVAGIIGEMDRGICGILLIPSVGNETWYRVGTYGWVGFLGKSRVRKKDVDEIFRISEERVFKIV